MTTDLSSDQTKDYLKQIIKANNPINIPEQTMNNFLHSSLFNQPSPSIKPHTSHHHHQSLSSSDTPIPPFNQSKIKQSIITFQKQKPSLTKCINSPTNRSSKLLTKSSSVFDIHHARYAKHNTQDLCYKLYKEYSKIKFKDETNFITRMELYATKKALQNDKIEELVKQNKIHISEEERTKTFNRLIQDSNKRIEKMKENEIKRKMNNNNDDTINKRNTHLRSKSVRTFDKNKWDKVYERFVSKLNETNKHIEELRKAKMEKEEEEYKEQQRHLQKFRKVKTKKEMKESTNRLHSQRSIKHNKKKMNNNNKSNNNVNIKLSHFKTMNLLEERMKYKQNPTMYKFIMNDNECNNCNNNNTHQENNRNEFQISNKLNMLSINNKCDSTPTTFDNLKQ